jgi:integrase/recombinase XerD
MWVRSLEIRYSPTSVFNKVNAIKSLLSFGQKIGYLQFNVGSAVDAPKPKDLLSQRILTQADVRKLIEATRTERDRVMLSLAYACGLGVSELCGLSWSDLQPRGDAGQATVYGKGGNTRVVLIPALVWQRLISIGRSSKTDAVFVSCTGRAMERTMVHRIVKDCARQAGVSEKASSHWLRHSHATHAIEGGCDLHLLQQSLGHSSLAITSKYLHARPDAGSSQFVDI